MKKVLEVKDLYVYYKEKKGKKTVVNGTSFHINEGEIVGLIGESGCGKSTLSKAILGMISDIEGEINLADDSPQMIFQDPFSSLNPAKTVGWLLEEPLKIKRMKKEQRKAEVEEIIEKVGLDKSYLNRKPSDLSGGQRQRVAIAMALITKPKLIIADEPVSALDVTIGAQIMRLMITLQEETGVSYLFISHDMDVVYQMCDRVLMMQDGKVMEYNM